MIIFDKLHLIYRRILFFLIFVNSQILFSQEDITYFLPQDEKYNDNIPKPSEILGFDIGHWHINHDKLVNYLTELSNSSNKIKIENRGYTYEDRPLVLLTIGEKTTQDLQEEEAILNYQIRLYQKMI